MFWLVPDPHLKAAGSGSAKRKLIMFFLWFFTFLCALSSSGSHPPCRSGLIFLLGFKKCCKKNVTPKLFALWGNVLNLTFFEGFGTKKDYTVYLKDYMKKVIKYLEDNKRYILVKCRKLFPDVDIKAWLRSRKHLLRLHCFSSCRLESGSAIVLYC